MATVAMTFIFGAALYANHRADLLGPVPSWPEFALDVVLLHHTIYMVDVLNMYTLWMGLGVLVLWALAKNKLPYVLGVSLGFWTAYQVDLPGQISSPGRLPTTRCFMCRRGS
jgi:hypothetical protein